jgi:drug/metabolite transporter (DMT)-like permease
LGNCYDACVIQASLRPYLWMLFGSFSFAWMGILAHEVGQVYDWQVLAIIRCSIPVAIVGSLALASGVKLVFFRPRVLWMRSLAGSFSLIGTFYALPLLPVADVFTLVNVFPIWVALLSWPLLGEPPNGQVWLSVLSGVIGVCLIQQPHLESANYVALVPLGVSIFTALAMIGLHRLKGIDPRAVVVHFSMVALCFAIASFFLFGREKAFDIPVGTSLWQLIGVGVCATIGQLCLTMAFTHGDPAKVAVVGLTQIVFTLILDALVLGHPPETGKLIGVPLIIAPTAWLMLRQRFAKHELLPQEPFETPAPE